MTTPELTSGKRTPNDGEQRHGGRAGERRARAGHALGGRAAGRRPRPVPRRRALRGPAALPRPGIPLCV